jgi:outer membrane protein assembly factor BamB
MSLTFRRFACAALFAGVAAGLAVVYAADGTNRAGDWAFYSADNSATKYSAADQINPSNVSSLHVAWRRPQVDPAILSANAGLRISNRFTASPIMVNGVLYAPDGLGLVEAMDPATGRTLWTQPPLTPGADGLLALRVPLWDTAYRFAPGHRLRVQVSSGAHPRFVRNLGSGEPLATGRTLVAAQQHVFHDPARPSALVLG